MHTDGCNVLKASKGSRGGHSRELRSPRCGGLVCSSCLGGCWLPCTRRIVAPAGRAPATHSAAVMQPQAVAEWVCGALACALLVLLRSLLSVLGCRGFSLRVYVFSVHPLGCTCGSSHGTISSAAAMDDAALEDAQQHTARTLKALQNRSRVSRTERVLTKQARTGTKNEQQAGEHPARDPSGTAHHCVRAQHNPQRAAARWGLCWARTQWCAVPEGSLAGCSPACCSFLVPVLACFVSTRSVRLTLLLFCSAFRVLAVCCCASSSAASSIAAADDIVPCELPQVHPSG